MSSIARADDSISYEDAALLIGCDHHYVRMLTSRGKFRIIKRVEVRPNVLKVFISRVDVDAYIERHRNRQQKKVRLTEEEWAEFRRVFGSEAIK